ncbi:hypothetical protein JOE59_003470 [Agromyces cerinus]|uniref:hypothetical protein n=1 Tax=Agromyces cerinus TaxID=33878 RepID=UPI00195D0167|nr:hypothetical protein [Agromyces cerinus]MBM7832765.1 hypothetical protein [Agromyces cerinus]
MDRAKHTPTGRGYGAEEFAKLPTAVLARYRGELECEECQAAAYFVRKRLSGTSYYFGARPHKDGCTLATSAGETDHADLAEAARREAEDGIVRLVPDRSRGAAQDHVEHDPEAEEGAGNARRYSKDGEAGRTLGTIQMSSLLGALLHRPDFADSDYELRLEDNTTTTVHRYCVELNQVTKQHHRRRHLYWGTVLFAGEADDRGGAWLYTAKGLPNLLMTKEVLEQVMTAKKIDDIADLAGASFILWGWINLPKDKPGGRPFLVAGEADKFGLRLG